MPTDVRTLRTSTKGRTTPVMFRVPLTGLDAAGRAVTIDHPPGPTTVFDGDATIDVDGFAYDHPNVEVPLVLKGAVP